jgi:hypothetical protein
LACLDGISGEPSPAAGFDRLRLERLEAAGADVGPVPEQTRERGTVDRAHRNLHTAGVARFAAIDRDAKDGTRLDVAHFQHQRRFAGLDDIGAGGCAHRKRGIHIDVDHGGGKPEHFGPRRGDDFVTLGLEGGGENVVEPGTHRCRDRMHVALVNPARRSTRAILILHPILAEGDLGRIDHDLRIGAEVRAR